MCIYDAYLLWKPYIVKWTLQIQMDATLYLLAKSFLWVKWYTKIFDLIEDKAICIVTSQIPHNSGKYFNIEPLLLTISLIVTQVCFLKHDFLGYKQPWIDANKIYIPHYIANVPKWEEELSPHKIWRLSIGNRIQWKKAYLSIP